MGFSVSGLDGFEEELRGQLVESSAQAVADVARENGWTTTENIDITDSEGLDVAAVRRRADEILRG